MKRRAPLAFALLLCFCLRTDGALNGTVAIVTTIGGAPKNQLFTFLCYHLAAGFDHVFVFFDNPKSPDLAVAKAFGPEEVTPIVNGPELFENWKASRLFNKFAGFRDEEVMARQILNADWAVHESKRMGFQWLLHLDVDEAFYGEGVDVQQHFLELSARGYSQGVYLVNEGVPQKPWMSLSQGGEAFMRTTLFKRNVVNIHTPAAQQAKNEFAQTRGGAWHQGYFVGKSAGRMTHDIFPLEVTRWFVNHKGTTQAVFDVPSIRHFINLSPAAIVDKYKQIGDFSDTTWDPKRVDPAFLPHKDKFPPSSKGLQYHNYMRDVAKRGPKAVKAEVERQSLLSDYQLTKMLDTGAFFRDETLSAFIKEQCPIAQWKKNKFTGHRPRAAGTCSSDGECGLEPPTDIDATLSHGLVNPTYCKGQPTTKAGSSERVTCFLKAGPDCCAAVKASRGTLKIPNEAY